MQRPAYISEADIVRWDGIIGSVEIPPELVNTPLEQVRIEVGYVGCWLEEVLAALGFDEEHISMSKESLGQICYGRPDPWVVGAKVIELAKTGTIFKPGRALAEALIRGRLNETFGPGGTLRSREEALDMLTTMGVASVDELVKKFGCSSPEELKDLLEKRMAEQDASR